MALSTKSIQEQKGNADGIRVCIMRRIKPEFVFDIWFPALAPSTELLKDYHDQKITWVEYEARFAKEVLRDQEKYLQIVSDISKKYDVTILCWEDTPEKCHRRLVAEKIQQKDPTLLVTIK